MLKYWLMTLHYRDSFNRHINVRILSMSCVV
uniref:Uncharacterized protein n=1 Tax=Rhizophora mucronata TaxID=61149 RepID=A0A2P2R2X6_RHIMU